MASGAIWPPSLPAEPRDLSKEGQWATKLACGAAADTNQGTSSMRFHPESAKLTHPRHLCQDTSAKIPQPRFCDQHASSPGCLTKISQQRYHIDEHVLVGPELELHHRVGNLMTAFGQFPNLNCPLHATAAATLMSQALDANYHYLFGVSRWSHLSSRSDSKHTSVCMCVCENKACRPRFWMPKRQRFCIDSSEKCSTRKWAKEVAFET